jgi:hypothetical protein
MTISPTSQVEFLSNEKKNKLSSAYLPSDVAKTIIACTLALYLDFVNMFLFILKLIFYSWVLKVILYQHITRCKKSLGTTVAAL